MSRRPPDFSFVRDGRPLSAWLIDLVADEAPARLAAGEALKAMLHAIPDTRTSLAEIDWSSSHDLAGHGNRLREKIRAAAAARGFPTPEFVRRLIAYRIALKEDWRRRADRAREFEEQQRPIEERLLRRIQDAGDEAERARATDRYLRWACASEVRNCKRDREFHAGEESATAAGMMAKVVFDALDEALLADRPGLRAMLDHESFFHDAAEALARIGPPAVDFAGFFLDRLDAQEDPYRFRGARALGSIGRDDPAVIDGLLRRLRSGPEAVRFGAAEALGHAGPPLAGRLEIAIDLLLGATYNPALAFAATVALASVGRDREEALNRVLELAAPKPPRWQSPEEFPGYRYDAAMAERGPALDALRHFRRFAARVVPLLVDALDTFEEYDSDWSYHGEHARVCRVLEAFGPDAAPAVPRLLRYLDDWQAKGEEYLEWPKDAFGLLAAIGPPAAEALAALEHLRAARSWGDETSPGDLNPDDALDRAILSIRGDLPAHR